MVKLYEYKISMNMSDGTTKEKRYKAKKDIETDLGLSLATINSILQKRTINKYNYMVIEKIPVENLEERRKERRKEYMKTYYDKMKKDSAKDKIFKAIEEKFKVGI